MRIEPRPTDIKVANLLNPSVFSKERLEEENIRVTTLLNAELAKSNFITRFIAKRILKSKYSPVISKTMDSVTDTGFDIMQKL